MPLCNINLAEGIIWSRRQRLMAYRALILYFALMALLLVLTVGRGVHKIYTGAQYYRQSRELQQEFTRHYPEGGDLLDYAGQLKEQLEMDAARIESINTAMPPSIHTPLPALILLANQPGKSMLHRLTFAQQTKNAPVSLRFDLITPVNHSQGDSPAKDFLKKWQADPVLARQFPEIKQLKVRRSELASGPVFITQYEALSKD